LTAFPTDLVSGNYEADTDSTDSVNASSMADPELRWNWDEIEELRSARARDGGKSDGPTDYILWRRAVINGMWRPVRC